MRAITVSEYGGTPAVTELPMPQPGPGQVLIETQAAGMNPADRTIAAGGFKGASPATFPLILGLDVAGEVAAVGEGATRFSRGDEVFGQLWTTPLGTAGSFADDVAVTEDAPLARIPKGLDPIVAAALPTAGGTGLAIVESLEPLDGKTVLIVGAGGGVGSFATQFAANAGARVIANAHADAAQRMRAYGATETIDHTAVSLPDAVRRAYPEGIDVLIDVANDADGLAELALLVRPGGTALTTRSAADTAALATAGVTGVNFQFTASSDLLQRLADAVVGKRIVPPPIAKIELDDVPDAMTRKAHADGKTVVTL